MGSGFFPSRLANGSRPVLRFERIWRLSPVPNNPLMALASAAWVIEGSAWIRL
jgi:hypothetical protein